MPPLDPFHGHRESDESTEPVFVGGRNIIL
jgi:hypothetical protein